MQSKYLQNQKDDSDNCSNWHSILHVKIKETIELAAGVEVELDEGVEPIEVDELLEEERRGDLGFWMNEEVPRVWAD